MVGCVGLLMASARGNTKSFNICKFWLEGVCSWRAQSRKAAGRGGRNHIHTDKDNNINIIFLSQTIVPSPKPTHPPTQPTTSNHTSPTQPTQRPPPPAIPRRSKLQRAASAQQRSINEAILGAQHVGAQAEALRAEAPKWLVEGFGGRSGKCSAVQYELWDCLGWLGFSKYVCVQYSISSLEISWATTSISLKGDHGVTLTGCTDAWQLFSWKDCNRWGLWWSAQFQPCIAGAKPSKRAGSGAEVSWMILAPRWALHGLCMVCPRNKLPISDHACWKQWVEEVIKAYEQLRTLCEVFEDHSWMFGVKVPCPWQCII